MCGCMESLKKKINWAGIDDCIQIMDKALERYSKGEV